MSEEPENTAVEQTNAPPLSEQQPEPEARAKPEGYEYLNLDELEGLTPEGRQKVQKKISNLFKQVKQSDAKRTEVEEFSRRHIEDLYKEIETLKSSQNRKDSDEQMNSLKQQRAAAAEKGDQAEYDRLDDLISDLKVERKIAALRTAVKQKQPQGPQPLPASVQQRIDEFANETDDDGNFVRPWSMAGHPRYKEAQRVTTQILNDPEFADLSFEERLEELDRRMKPAQRSKAPSVLGGTNLTGAPTSKTMQLTAEQKYAADRMLSGVYPDPVKRYAAYAKNLKKEK